MTPADASARVGLFGGTFNPIHVGHLRAAEEVAEALGLERVLFVPSALPPHKPPEAGAVLAPARLRLEWVRLAVSGNPRFEVEPLEIERGGPSYSVETLRVLAPRFEPKRPVFVIGSDAFAEIGSWRQPAALLALAHFAVPARPPRPAGGLRAWLPPDLAKDFDVAPDGRSAAHRRAGTWIRAVDITALDVSASDIRRRLRERRSVRYLLPETVREAVEASGIYVP